MNFYDQIGQYANSPALIDAETGVIVTYSDLELLVRERVEQLGAKRKLVFIEAKSDIPTIVIYLACLRGGHVVHLLESVTDPKAQSLIDAYKPNLIFGLDRSLRINSSFEHVLHPDLCLLLSTSGSTGTPKFVKLSSRNIQSNALAISEYLGVDQSEKAFSHLKPYYSYGLSVINSHIAAGAALILTSRSITEPEFLIQMRQYRATSLAGVPYTYETLLRIDFDLTKFDDLRTLTQAGGKLESNLVLRYAKQCRELGKKFFVMYGQTEAAPRMAYLPPRYVESYPESIGLAIPGGELLIVDADHKPVEASGVQGELAYKGQNVMMGYALSAMDLSSDETPNQLLTGDIAYKNDDGIFFVVGRTSRFVKIFGLRLNLDQIQSDLKKQFGEVAVSGDDRKIKIAVRQRTKAECEELVQTVSREYKLPDSCFAIRSYDEMPILPNGKYDYGAILAGVDQLKPLSWIGKLKGFVSEVLEINDKDWDSVFDIYKKILNLSQLGPNESFDSLGADSLSYVSLSIELEGALGASLPVEWRSIKVSDLEQLFIQKKAIAG